MSIRSWLVGVYRNMQRLIVPDLRYAQYLYEDVLRDHVCETTTWLDLGCGHQLLPPWRAAEEAELVRHCRMIVGLDPELEAMARHATIHRGVGGHASHLPFKDASFDLLTANMVVEHLQQPREQFAEIHRVLRPGGIFLFHTPNVFGYGTIIARLIPQPVKNVLARMLHARDADDIFPAYYRANSRAAVERLARECGFTIRQIKYLVSSALLVVIPPLVLLELLLIKMLMTRAGRRFRPNLIVILQKRSPGEIDTRQTSDSSGSARSRPTSR